MGLTSSPRLPPSSPQAVAKVSDEIGLDFWKYCTYTWTEDGISWLERNEFGFWPIPEVGAELSRADCDKLQDHGSWGEALAHFYVKERESDFSHIEGGFDIDSDDSTRIDTSLQPDTLNVKRVETGVSDSQHNDHHSVCWDEESIVLL